MSLFFRTAPRARPAERQPIVAPPFVSPYAVLGPDDAGDPVWGELDSRLHAAHVGPAVHTTRKSLPFSLVVDTLDQCGRAGTTTAQKRELVAQLFRATEDTDDPTLERLNLLRILLPQLDHRTVYGFKTARLIRGFSKALAGTSPAVFKVVADLSQWLQQPKLVPGLRDGTVVTLPEVEMSLALAACQPRVQQRSAETRELTIADIAGFCTDLSDAYAQRQKEHADDATEAGSLAALGQDPTVDCLAQRLGPLLRQMDGRQCRVLMRLLLRTVTMGVSPDVVLPALSPVASHFMKRQQDLARLADSIDGSLAAKTPPELVLPSQLVYGVPFAPMTCGSPLASPYSLPWLFSRAEMRGKTVGPAGRLIIMSDGQWYVPNGSTKVSQNDYVNLESPEAMAIKSRGPFVKLLRAFRAAKLLDEANARGYVIIFHLKKEEKDGRYMLLESVLPATSLPVSFQDKRVKLEAALDDPGTRKAPTKARRAAKTLAEEECRARLKLIAGDRKPGKGERGERLWVTTKFEEGGKLKDLEALQKKGVIVQTKFDGDRVVVMVYPDPKTKAHKVKAFTKNGKSVEVMYSDPCDELKAAAAAVGPATRFILDGEMTLVDANGKQLPWTDAKWRYNTGGRSQQLSELMSDRTLPDTTIVTGLFDDDFVMNGPDYDTFVPFSFASLQALRRDPALAGADGPKNMQARVIPGARLCYMVFDILAHDTRDLITTPCLTRLEYLNSDTCKFLRNLTYVRPLTEWAFAKSANDLVHLLEEAVKNKEEGKVLKVPYSSYEFGRSMYLRKLKVRGPDINTAVAGLGFSLSKNPRQWALLCAVETEDRRAYIAYCKVECLQGDNVAEGPRHIHAMSALVCVAQLYKASQASPIVVGTYSVYPLLPIDRSKPTQAVTVAWKPQHACDATPPAIVHFLRGLPRDVQWLCHPRLAPFGLSVHGDPYPIDYKHGASAEQVASTLLTPRFPVGRVEFNLDNRSKCDTESSIKLKFDEACAIDTYLDRYMRGRVRSLRRAPCSGAHMEEARRILWGMENPDVEWPQQPPAESNMAEIESLFKRSAFGELQAAERSAFKGIDPPSQWLALQAKTLAPLVDTEESLARKAQLAAMLPTLLQQMRQLKAAGFHRPIVVCGASIVPDAGRGAASRGARSCFPSPVPDLAVRAHTSQCRRSSEDMVVILPVASETPLMEDPRASITDDLSGSDSDDGCSCQTDQETYVQTLV